MNYTVQKRNGRVVQFNPNKLRDRIKNASNNLTVNYDNIFVQVTQGIVNGMTTTELDNLVATTSANLVSIHPDYGKLAAYISISRHHKDVELNFDDLTDRLYDTKILNDAYYDKKNSYGNLNEFIDYQRDFNFDYFGWKSLEQLYLLKHTDSIIAECPQHMYMRCAIALSHDKASCLKLYNNFSNHFIALASPIMINAGTKIGNMISCELHELVEDSKEGLLETFSDLCSASAKASGLGLAASKIRSGKSLLSNGGKAAGLLKYEKILNEGMRFFDQSGRRPGSVSIYIEPWHLDIEDHINAKLPSGAEEMRARDIFTALWIPDLFMKRVEEDAHWTLVCPNEVIKAGFKPLWSIYGEEFEKEYVAIENAFLEQKIPAKIVNARDLWQKIIKAQVESGVPYMAFKDHVNHKNMQSNIGVITSSNLCIEIELFHDKNTVSTCILSSIPLQKYVELNSGENCFNFEKMGEIVQEQVYALNQLIDINQYSTLKAKKGAEEQRAIGIGVQGFADVLAMLDLYFDHPEVESLNKKIFECIYYNALLASNNYAKEKGIIYPYFNGSPISKGVFQFDMWDIDRNSLYYDWKALECDIKKYGIANSTLTALMPTASSARPIGSNECFEPFFSNIYTRRTKDGEYMIVNSHLINDFIEMGIWDENMKNMLVQYNGSLKTIPFEEILQDKYDIYKDRIEHLKLKYRTVYEYSQRHLIDLCADRAPFIDQSQSMNIFMENPTQKTLSSSHFYAWKRGLKTGMYYLRSRSIQVNNKHLAISSTVAPVLPLVNDTDIGCLGCE